jgi:hypothetical protein
VGRDGGVEVSDVPDDADDGAPGAAVRGADADAFSDRVGAAPEGARRALRDEENGFRVGAVPRP